MNKIAFQLNAYHSRYKITPFCSCDLDLDPMTLIYEIDLDIPKSEDVLA